MKYRVRKEATTVATKTAAKAAAKPAAKAQKAPAKKRVARGDSYECVVCGLAVSVDTTFGCVEACDIVCCGKPMKEKKAKVKAAK